MEHENTFRIVVNGTEHTVPHEVVTYNQVVEIAFPNHPVDPTKVFSVTFDDAESKPHQGTLAEGGKVSIKRNGTIFDVTETIRS